jgi:hypothetical protein
MALVAVSGLHSVLKAAFGTTLWAASLDTNGTTYRYTADGWKPADLSAAALAGPRWRAISAPEAVARQRAIHDQVWSLDRGTRYLCNTSPSFTDVCL